MKGHRTALTYVYLIAAFTALTLLQIKHPIDADEGIILDGAWNLINGRTLYTDFFQFIPPLSFYIVYWTWRLFGVSYAAARIMAIGAVLASTLGVYFCSKLLVRSKLALIAPTLFMIISLRWSFINHNVFFLPFSVWAIYFYIKSIEGTSRRDTFLSGLFTGLGMLVLHSQGALIAAVSIGMLALRGFRAKGAKTSMVAATYAAGVFLPVSIILLKWNAADLYRNLILPLATYRSIHFVDPRFYLVTLIVILGLVFSFRKERRLSVWYVFAIQLLLMVSILPNPAYVHILLVIYPFLIIVPLAIQRLRTSDAKFVQYLSIAAHVLLIGFIAFKSIAFLVSHPPLPSTNRREIITTIQDACPGPYIYAGPFFPIMYFETRKLNPTPYYLLLPGFQPEEHFSIAIDRLEHYRPTCAVMFYPIVQQFRYEFTSVDYYLRDNYRIIRSFGNLLILQRRDLQSET